MFGDKDYDTSISRAMLSLRDVLGAPPPGVAQKPMGMPPGQQPQMPQQQPQMPQQQQQQNGQGAALAQLMQRMHMPQPGQQPQMPQQQPQMPQQQQQNGQGAALAQLMQRMHMPQPGQMTNGPLSRAMSPGQMPRSFAEGGRVESNPDRGYGTREDGSFKGNGFYGMLPRLDDPRQRSSEYSVGLDLGDGRETSVPSMVPGLSRDQMNYLLSHEMPSQDILDKARSFAVQRHIAGLPYFARPQEENKLTVPRR